MKTNDKYNEIEHNLFLAQNTTGSHWALVICIACVALVVWLV